MRIISGSLKNRKLHTPKGQRVRPTSERMREMVFNSCQTEIVNATFLDLFAGTGAMGIEAISRGAKQSFFIDNHLASIQIIKKNIEVFSLQKQTSVILGDVCATLPKLDQQFDLIYIDPPYAHNTNQIIQKISEIPHILQPETRLYIETSYETHLLQSLGILTLFRQKKVGSSLLAEYHVAY